MLSTKFDGFIGACGYEKRCRYAASKLRFSLEPNKLVVPFTENRVLERQNNEAFFKESDFKFTQEIDGSNTELLATTVQNIIDTSRSSPVRLAIDYSGMTRAWYGALVLSLLACSLRGKRLEVVFVYAPSVFSEPTLNPPRNKIAEPLPGYCHFKSSSDPTALVIGLGYETHRAAGIRSYLDPEQTVLFLTDPALDARFTSAVKWSNSVLLNEVSPKWIFPHPLADLDYTASILYDVVCDLEKKYRVVIAPLGVKPFSLLSMLLVARYQFADVWRVSGAELSPPISREAMGPLVCYQVIVSD